MQEQVNIELDKAEMLTMDTGSVTWRSPSNIALIKYWGKHGMQLPTNASISFTLEQCYSETTIKWTPRLGAKRSIKFLFDGEEKPSFLPKIKDFFERISPYMGNQNEFDLEIHSSNSFPHSSGIASSASGMSALALCIADWENRTLNAAIPEMMKKASFLSRLGSGSACRSLYKGLVSWGQHDDLEGSSDEYGTLYPHAHKMFSNFKDAILIIDKGVKHVSSTVGHGLMNGHPFASTRFETAKTNMADLLDALNNGDIKRFIMIVEAEALMLHAMMMTSSPYYLLLKPNTVKVIEEIWDYRKKKSVPMAFTLDAGANVHLLYDGDYEDEIVNFIRHRLTPYCQNGLYICDNIGSGPSKINEE